MSTTISGIREVLVTSDSGRKPKIVSRLRDGEYIEHSLMRLIAAWGRYFPEWNDKVVCHRHIWEQAECVARLRERQAQFPSTTGNLDAPVSRKLEQSALRQVSSFIGMDARPSAAVQCAHLPAALLEADVSNGMKSDSLCVNSAFSRSISARASTVYLSEENHEHE